MTCPCEDMKILQRQQDSDGLLNGIWTGQRLHGLGIFPGIQVQGVWVHPCPSLPTPCPGLLLWLRLCLCVGEMFLHRSSTNPAPAPQINPAGPW